MEKILRPSKDEYYLNLARDVSKRSTCKKTQYGAVIVNNDIIVSTGYNGSPRGGTNCSDIPGDCQRVTLNIPSGTRYELCKSVHAEANAIINAGREKCLGAVMYLFGVKTENREVVVSAKPCTMCRKLIINSGIKTLVTANSDGTIQTLNAEQILAQDIVHLAD